MLVITRKLDQSIIINGNVEVVVTGLGKDGVRLGIIAPQMVTVLRSELLEEVRSETQASAVAPAEFSQVQLLSQRLKGLTAKKK